jgi:hypothetical protein
VTIKKTEAVLCGNFFILQNQEIFLKFFHPNKQSIVAIIIESPLIEKTVLLVICERYQGFSGSFYAVC